MLGPQFLQQGIRLLEVGRVKTLGEPAIDRRQQLVRLGPLAPLPPQAGQAHRGAQFQRLRLLAAGDAKGSLEAGFRFQP